MTAHCNHCNEKNHCQLLPIISGYFDRQLAVLTGDRVLDLGDVGKVSRVGDAQAPHAVGVTPFLTTNREESEQQTWEACRHFLLPDARIRTS